MRAAEVLLAAQVQPIEASKQLAEKFGLSQRMCSRYVARVLDRWEKEAGDTKPIRKHQVRQSLRTVFQAALQQQKLKVCVDALREMAKIDGLYEPIQVGIGGGVEVGAGMGLGMMGFKSGDDVRERIEELEARLLNGGPRSTQYLEATCVEESKPGNGRGNGYGNGRGNGHGIPH